MSTMWVKRPMGAELRCRVVCKGCCQATTDKDDAYASTTLLMSLNLLLLIGLTESCTFNFYGIRAAFLHTELGGDVQVPTG